MSACLIQYINRLSRGLNYLSMITVVVIMVMTIAGIAFRLVGIQFSGVTNLSESLLVMAVYLSVAYAQQNKQHVSVELFLIRVNERAREGIGALNLVIALAICSVILYTSWDYALTSWRLGEKMDGAPFYPIYPPKLAIAFGITCLWLQLLADFLAAMLALFPPKKPKAAMDLRRPMPGDGP